MSEEQRLDNLGINSELPTLERERRLRKKLQQVEDGLIEDMPSVTQLEPSQSQKRKNISKNF